jgi:hypothetical protein
MTRAPIPRIGEGRRIRAWKRRESLVGRIANPSYEGPKGFVGLQQSQPVLREEIETRKGR